MSKIPGQVYLWLAILIFGASGSVTRKLTEIGQFFWLKGLKESPIATSAIVSCFHPIAGIFFAYWILGETPTLAQLVGSSILLVGLLISQAKSNRQHKVLQPSPEPATDAGGFKGL
jgi:drug/metabolite transporter (DMT)-like permease